MSEVAEAIVDIIAKEASLEGDRIRLDSTMQDLAIESIDAVQIMFAIEERFGIDLPADDASIDFSSVGGLVQAVEARVQAKQSA